jgi:hypothetical protein
MMKIVNFLLAIMFMIFAFLQLNDPDPVLWILIYGVMSVVCILGMFEFYPRKILIGLAIFYSLYSLYYWPGIKEWLGRDQKEQLFDNLAKMEHPFIEESREFLGLLICAVVLCFFIWRSYRRTALSSH